MAHRALIGGTAYEISGGKTLVGGTAYSIAKGRTLVGGTGYDVPFISPAKVKDLYSTSIHTTPLAFMTYANGYWVVGGTTTLNGSTIAYTTQIDGSWTTQTISVDEGNIYLNGIAYGDGYWVLAGQKRIGTSSGDYAVILYATSLSGPWTEKVLWGYSSIVGSSAECITYAGGYWAVGGCFKNSSTYYARIAYATSLSGTWTTKDLWNGTGSSINCITYANNLWAIGGTGYSNGYIARIGYAANISASFTTKDLWTSGGYEYGDIYSITYANGYWVVAGHHLESYNGSSYARIAYSTSLSGTWTTKDLWNGPSNSSVISQANYICYADGKWVAVGCYYDGTSTYTRLLYATSLAGTWTVITLWNSVATYYSVPPKYVNYADGYWLVGGNYFNGSSTFYSRITYGESLESFEQL